MELEELLFFLIISVTNKNWTFPVGGSKLSTETERGTQGFAPLQKGMILVNHNYFTQRDVERLEQQAV